MTTWSESSERPSTVAHGNLLALGATVRACRLEKGMLQTDLAARARLHRTVLGEIERGQRDPSFTRLLRLARALDVPLPKLLARAEEAIR